MDKQPKLTLTGLIVVIVVIFFAVLIFMPALAPVKKIAERVICATNLKGLGNAMIVYSNDYYGRYPQLGKGPWAKELGYSYEDPTFSATSYEGPCTITSSWYLLVREADVSPKSFLCPQVSKKKLFQKPPFSEFTGENTKDLDMVELWDFGPDPYQHVNYAMHNPYGRFPANERLSSSFAVAADMNPWFSYGNILPAGSEGQSPQIINIFEGMKSIDWSAANATYHKDEEKIYNQGQNILFADGHSEWEKQPNVGVKYDNIYTYWSTDENPTEQDKQGGTAPTSRSAENDAKSRDDSFLAI